ncbi:hypothetical protein B0H16DRAFT_1449064 [Mycena metata]|uniref:Uncharacterized protein n=1 Tax=Mycena metata TaxID=1033252 RepID=A0AAD7K4W9_9AGAR|nr:hypothetical protein B0H16DRAFT_1449064 [Mycena metata]
MWHEDLENNTKAVLAHQMSSRTVGVIKWDVEFYLSLEKRANQFAMDTDDWNFNHLELKHSALCLYGKKGRGLRSPGFFPLSKHLSIVNPQGHAGELICTSTGLRNAVYVAVKPGSRVHVQ